MTEHGSPTAAPGRHSVGLDSLDAEIEVGSLPVTGSLPGWLSGELIRNGPAKFEAGRSRYRHWFDGQAMLHRFAFSDGTVSYRNRFLDTPGLRSARDQERIGFQEFATDPCGSLFARLLTRSRRPPSGNACVSITPMAGDSSRSPRHRSRCGSIRPRWPRSGWSATTTG